MATTTKDAAYLGPGTVTASNVNSLANGSYADFGTTNVLDNTSDLALFCDFWLTFTLGAASGSGTVDVYLLPFDYNATAYPAEFGSTTPPPASCKVGGFQLTTSATTHSSVPLGPSVSLGPGKYRVVLGNLTGQAFAASANVTFAYNKYNLQNV